MNTLRHGTVSGTSLDDWEMTVIRHGRATRDRPAGVLLGDLHSDLVELDQAISRHPPASSLRRLTRATAHMSGLMCLTLCKLDQRSAFRRWARTARLAANEAGDPETFSWVLAQEAYGHFYSGDFSEAIDVARQAQDVSRSTPCVGTALAAALEARAYAVTNRPKETRVALGQAESNLSNLSGTALEASAFGYNEAQLRFHEGNAYTHLGDMASALPAQERALILCAEGDYTDWSLTRLDRTKCLAKTGNTFDAMAYGSETLLSLSEDRRGGIIALRGLEVFNSLSDEQKLSKSASDFRDILMHTANAERY
jgi:tetratricopeptide (TPR) repeat protein